METAARILLVEDDPRAAELVRDYLASRGMEVEIEADGARAAARILEEQPDLVILDWMLPGEDGLSICRKVRGDYEGSILMLTARGDDIDQIVGLEVGADDYLAKPANPRLLLARIQALLRRTRRSAPSSEDRVEVGELIVDRAARIATVSGVAVPLSTAEFDLLWLLTGRAGHPVTRDILFEELRGIRYDGFDRSMDMRVSQVRKVLAEADPLGRDWIKTVRSVGYQLARPG